MKSSNPFSESARVAAVQSPIIPVVADLIQRHPGTISLGQGVVSYGPPPEAIAAVETFLRDPQNHKYKRVIGIAELHAEIETKLRLDNGISHLTGRSLVVTAGGNQAFLNAILAIADHGDEIILQTPYYFNHEMAIVMIGCCPVLVPTSESYQLQIDAIRSAITPRTKAVVTVSPNNPTGAVYPESDLRAVNELCREMGIYHISDEAYEYFVYSGASHFSAGSIAGSEEHTISLYSLSKAYGFASWRIGYMLAPEHLLTAIQKIQDTIVICPPVISQFAAAAALRTGRSYFGPKIDELAGIREMVLEKLQPLQNFCHVPLTRGAFYFLLRVETAMPALALVERLVRESGVAAIPGNAFGIADGCVLRIAYGALERKTVEEGMGRLVRGLENVRS